MQRFITATEQFEKAHPEMIKQVNEFSNALCWLSLADWQMAQDAADHLDNDILAIWIKLVEALETRGWSRNEPEFKAGIFPE